MKTIQFYGREVFEPGIYSKVFTVDQSTPTPSGNNTLVLLGEAPNGIKFGMPVQAGTLAENKALFGDKNPIVQAISHAQNPSGEVEAAQHILCYNVRSLVQASGEIDSTTGASVAITCKSKIYGVNGNSVKISQVTAVSTPLITVESSWMPTQTKEIDNPLFDISCVTALSTITADATKLSVYDGTISHDFLFSEYPTLGLMLQAIKDAVPVAVITKDVTTSDNTPTLRLFDHITASDITSLVTVKGDLRQLYDFLDLEVADIETTWEATATDMPADFSIQFTSGSIGADPTATEWTNLLAELEDVQVGAIVPVLDGIAAPYDSTLTKAINALVASHAVNMAAAEKRGKKRQVYLPHYGGSGYSGVSVAGATVDVTVTDSASYNSEYAEFVGFGLDDRDINGVELSFIPSYYAVKKASMAMGGPASRVLTGIGVSCVKATNAFKESDRLKLHKASVIFPNTDEKGTYTHMSYTSWKSDNDPMLTIPSRVRCGMLSDNDVARKLEAKKLEWAKSGFSPYIAQIARFIKTILDSHKQNSINWLTSYGEVAVTITGTQFNYTIADLVVPVIPEYGFGESTFVSS